MSRYIILCAAVILACQHAALSAGKLNQRAIDMVANGTVKTAQASWWGFNPEDSTEALQAAIDSGVETLIVDNVGKPWITRPLNLRNNQKIIFARGVEILAKRGEFRARNDSLFTARDLTNVTLSGYGATLRMRRADYAGPSYEKAEWRMALSIRGCSNVNIFGLTLAESGGDGIYLGVGKGHATNKNIHIKDVVCENNYRQGISVITAENLLIENTTMRGTAGTPPQAGIDFEPNHSDERLVNVVMRNCLTENNKGDGYEFHLVPLRADSEPVSVRIENCRSIGDHSCSVRVTTGNTPDRAVKGSIEFVDCSFENGQTLGVSILNKPAIGCKVRFVNCSILDPAPDKPSNSPIRFASRKDATEAVGGVTFENCLLRDPLNRRPFVYQDESGNKVPVKDVSGTIDLERDGQRSRVDIIQELRSNS